MPTGFTSLRKLMSLFLTLTIAVGPSITPALAGTAKKGSTGDSNTVTPIKHVIVIVGENRSFDHLFATYVPNSGDSVLNLLSEGIINADGTPGSNYSLATQFSADITGNSTYQLSPTTGKASYSVLPAPLNGGPTNVCTDNGMCNLGNAVSSEDGLPKPPFNYYRSLLVGGSGLTGRVPDSRISGVNASSPFSTLPPGPFQLTNTTSLPYNSYANSPVHRFYQMW
jgi:phospholipase C